MITATLVNRVRILSVVLLFINGVNALAAGYGFMVDPSGEGLGMTTAYLRHSPFADYLIPGVILFIANGILSIGIAFIVIKKGEFYPHLIMAQGIILTGWIIVQLFMLRFVHPLHLIMGIIGTSLVAIGMLIRRRELG
jgi:hypothetical protein